MVSEFKGLFIQKRPVTSAWILSVIKLGAQALQTAHKALPVCLNSGASQKQRSPVVAIVLFIWWLYPGRLQQYKKTIVRPQPVKDREVGWEKRTNNDNNDAVEKKP